VQPVIGIVMGSDSDLPVMRQAAATLEEFKIPYEINVVSAHRTPERAREYARTAEERGLAVIIAAAGGAAHLAGVMAAETTLPVIGVPVSSGSLQGMDALLATVQMPPGIPVATVAINGAKNAAILAVQILGAGDARIRAQVKSFKEKMARAVEAKNARLKSLGLEEYLREMAKD